MISFTLNYLLKALSQNAAILIVRIQHEFWEDTIQSLSTDKIRNIIGMY